MAFYARCARKQASETYVEIAESTYFSKQLGNTPYYDPDNARCDCSYKSDVSPSHQACGEYSGCMNRMLQMECEAGDCRCGGKCQNQRSVCLSLLASRETVHC